MPDLDDQIRESLERLTGPAGGDGLITFEQLGARRRRRARHRIAVGVVPVLVFVASAVLGISRLADGRETSVTAGPSQSESSIDVLVSVVETDVVGDAAGTTRVVMQFDGSLPSGDIAFVDDIVSVENPSEITYTVQDPERAHVCDATHDFGAIAIGTVDVLVPAGWFSDGDESYTSPLNRIGGPPKFVVCGPYRGYYQYSIWGPASADPNDVRVALEADRGRLTVDIAPHDAQTAPSPGTGEDSQASAAPTAEDFEQTCRTQVPDLLGAVANFELAEDAQAKVFEPRFENGSRTVVLFDDKAFYTCLVSGDTTSVFEAGGGPGTATAALADDQVQVIGQNWSGSEPSGSCVGQPCGPGTANYFGRVGAAVSELYVTLPDGSSVESSIEADRWFIVDVQVPAHVPLFQQRIQWTLDDGTQLNANPVDLADPGTIDTCSQTAAAIQVGDNEALAELGIPPRLDADLIDGRIDLRLCGSDNMTGEYVLVIGRTSGQVFVLRNTTRPLITTDDERASEALRAIEELTGAFLVTDDAVTTLAVTPVDQPSVPVVALFEDGTDP